MFEYSFNRFFALIVSFIVGVALTFVVQKLAHKYGFVAKPKADRWHKKPTAMYGGTAIFVSTVLMYFLFVPLTTESLVVMAGSSILFVVGLVDDLLNIKPYQKLIGQLIGTAVIVGFGLQMPLTGNEIIDISLTVFWLIGITNAINLLDNMDGLAAGISAIAAFSLAVSFAANGQNAELLLIAVFSGSLLGFLVYNFNPASIFMGDCGSMFVGFLLSSSVLLNQSGGRSRGIFSILAVPVLILFVPIFDTTFVTILRKMWGRKASEGGRDHTSHRLVALGLSERAAVLMLYAFAAGAGVLSLLVSQLQITQSLALIGAFTIALTIIGVYLSKVKVYKEQDEELATQTGAVFGFLIDLSYKRRVFEVILDTLLIALSYYAAYILIFGSVEDSETWSLFVKSLPILIVLKLGAFLVSGVYRGLWRYTSIGDFVTFTKGVVIGSVLSVLGVALAFRFYHYSRAVFVVDGIILLLALVGSRMAFRLFRELLPTPVQLKGRRTLIYGAGDGGEMILRELNHNPNWNYLPIGFVDDDPTKKDKIIHGLQVFGGNGSLQSICHEKDVEEILISFRKISAERLEEVKDICRLADVSLKRAQLKIESVDFE